MVQRYRNNATSMPMPHQCCAIARHTNDTSRAKTSLARTLRSDISRPVAANRPPKHSWSRPPGAGQDQRCLLFVFVRCTRTITPPCGPHVRSTAHAQSRASACPNGPPTRTASWPQRADCATPRRLAHQGGAAPNARRAPFGFASPSRSRYQPLSGCCLLPWCNTCRKLPRYAPDPAPATTGRETVKMGLQHFLRNPCFRHQAMNCRRHMTNLTAGPAAIDRDRACARKQVAARPRPLAPTTTERGVASIANACNMRRSGGTDAANETVRGRLRLAVSHAVRPLC